MYAAPLNAGGLVVKFQDERRDSSVYSPTLPLCYDIIASDSRSDPSDRLGPHRSSRRFPAFLEDLDSRI